MATVEDRLAALEAAVARLQEETASASSAREGAGERAGDPTGPATSPTSDGQFWIVEGVHERHPEGAVVFAGDVPTGSGRVRWQWGRDPRQLLEEPWDEAAGAFSALGHPVRLRLLQMVLNGTTSTAALADTEDLGTTGQLHHHLRTLVAAGWLRSTARGQYEVPAARVVPILVVIAAATD